ncbi:MAG: hypothetical protein IPM39_16405 [Chloroflexi bacterium]|nr:hypothetical protein [Chloroflexota bacterium]
MQSLRLRIVLVLGGLLAPAILWDVSPWLRGPQGWRWPLLPWPPWPNLLLSAVTAVLFLVGWWLLRHRAARQTQRALLALFALSLLLQASLLNLTPTTGGNYSPAALLFERLASAQASGYFTAAQEIDHLPDALRRYPQLMPNFSADPHPRSKPPGIVLAYYGSEQLLARLPAISDPLGQWARGVRCADMWLATRSNAALSANLLVALLTPLLAALIIWPAYGLAARQAGPTAGWLAAGLAALLPGRLAFAPHMDTLYPLLALLALSLADRGARRNDWRLGLLSGLVISLATYLSLVNALIAPLVGLFVLAQLAQERPDFWRRLAAHGLAISAGTVSVWLVYWLVSGVTPLDIYHAAAPARHDLSRSYWVWLVWNVYDFAMFAGLPLFVLALPRLAELRRWPTAVPLLPAFWLTFVALTVSGMIRGEVGRIWLMLAAAPLLLAARAWGNGRLAERAGLWLLLVVTAVSWAINVRWETTTLEWPLATPRVMATAVPTPTYPLTATFGPDIQLLGYDLAAGEPLDLTLYWQTQARTAVPYTVFIHVVDETGAIVAQRDVMPDNGRLPTTCWQPAEFISDGHSLTLDGLPAGTYSLRLGLYDQATGERLGEPVILTTLQR